MSKKLSWVLVGFLSLFLASCGFQLRRPHVMDPQLGSVYLNTAIPNDPFVQTLERVLVANNIQLVSTQKEATSTLNILNVTTTNTMMAGGGVNISGSYVAYLTVTFSVVNQHGQVLIPPSVVQESQNFMSNATQVLSGNNMATQLANQMQQSLAQNIVDRLAKVHVPIGS